MKNLLAWFKISWFSQNKALTLCGIAACGQSAALATEQACPACRALAQHC